jgi:hypothetical protein
MEMKAHLEDIKSSMTDRRIDLLQQILFEWYVHELSRSKAIAYHILPRVLLIQGKAKRTGGMGRKVQGTFRVPTNARRL